MFAVTSLDIETVDAALHHRSPTHWTQAQKFTSLVAFAAKQVPFYNRHWSALKPDDLRAGNARAFPFTCRDHVARELVDLCANDIGERRLFRHHTSGTSGEPVVAILDIHDWHMNLVSIANQFEVLGFPVLSPDTPRWSFCQVTAYPYGGLAEIETPLPGRPFWRKLNLATRQDRGERNFGLRALCSLLEAERVVLNGLPRVLIEVARQATAAGHRLPQPAMIITSGDVLSDEDRALLTALFRVSVFSFYSAGEVGLIAFECAARSYHLETNRLMVEVVPGGIGAVGEVCVTTLENYAMPLVRYRTGDFTTLLAAPCSCGDPRPCIGRVIGRNLNEYYEQLSSQSTSYKTVRAVPGTE